MREATEEATLPDLAAIFDPATGALSQFYNTALKNLLLSQGNTMVPIPTRRKR